LSKAKGILGYIERHVIQFNDVPDNDVTETYKGKIQQLQKDTFTQLCSIESEQKLLKGSKMM